MTPEQVAALEARWNIPEVDLLCSQSSAWQKAREDVRALTAEVKAGWDRLTEARKELNDEIREMQRDCRDQIAEAVREARQGEQW